VASSTLENAGVLPTDGPVKTRWVKLDSARSEQLKRKRDCAELTLPYLLPREGRKPGQSLYSPFSSDGSRGAKTLAAKLALALFPPQRAFFELTYDEAALTVAEADDPKVRDQVEEVLRPNVTTIMHEFDASKPRKPINGLLLDLIVVGDGLGIWESLEAPMRVIRPDSFVARRNGRGEVIEIVIHEMIGIESLPSDVQAQVRGRVKEGEANNELDLYTHILQQGNGFTTKQEVLGIAFNAGSFPTWEKSPFVGPFRWHSIDGENYGISHVEDNLGTLRTVEGLSKLLVQGSAALAKINVLVDPSTGLRPKDLTEADNGEVLACSLGGAVPFTVVTGDGKAVDFQVVNSLLNAEKASLRASFLQTESIQRDAERVTAEEIRMLAQELENALGGVYTALAEEFQTTILKRLIHLIKTEKPDALPAVEVDGVETALLTGLRALGAGHEMNNLQQFIATATQVPGAEAYLNVGTILTQMAKHLGTQTNIIRSNEEVQQQAAQAQQAQMMQSVAPGVAQEAAKSAMAPQQ